MLDVVINLVIFLTDKYVMGTELCSRPRAAQKSLAGRMRPAGRVFETPTVQRKRCIFFFKTILSQYV